MKYVVSATCRIKRHSKNKASKILWAFNPAVSLESRRPAKPREIVSKSLTLDSVRHKILFLIFNLLFFGKDKGITVQ